MIITKHDKPFGKVEVNSGSYFHLTEKERRPKAQRKKYRHWEDYELKKMHKRRLAGDSWKDISIMMGATVNAVRCAYANWVNLKGIDAFDKWRPWSEERLADLRARKERGEPDRTIAEEYGCSRQCVTYHRHRNGVRVS